jgi:AAA ATPase-like protein
MGVSMPLLSSTATVGREAERALLNESLARAAAGTAHAVLLIGDAGIGKTRLLAEMAATAIRHNALVLRGRGTGMRRPAAVSAVPRSAPAVHRLCLRQRTAPPARPTCRRCGRTVSRAGQTGAPLQPHARRSATAVVRGGRGTDRRGGCRADAGSDPRRPTLGRWRQPRSAVPFVLPSRTTSGFVHRSQPRGRGRG